MSAEPASFTFWRISPPAAPLAYIAYNAGGREICTLIRTSRDHFMWLSTRTGCEGGPVKGRTAAVWAALREDRQRELSRILTA